MLQRIIEELRRLGFVGNGRPSLQRPVPEPFAHGLITWTFVCCVPRQH